MSHLVNMNRTSPQLSEEELKELLKNIVNLLTEYLISYVPKRRVFTKHSVMGPVGKLISAMEAGRFNTVEGYVGYTVNIHENTGRTPPKKEDVEKLRKGVEMLLELKKKIGISRWPKIMREIDYAVYFNKVRWIEMRAEEKKKEVEEVAG